MTAKHYDGSLTDELAQTLKQDGVEYAVIAGRRAPMHSVHVDCIEEVANAGLTPVILVGSTNGADNFLYNPLSNPLTKEQQEEQLRSGLPANIRDKAKILFMDDVGDNYKWTHGLADLLKQNGIAPEHTVMHYRSKASDVKSITDAVKPLSSVEAYLANLGIGSWQSKNRTPDFDSINATELRTLDLSNSESVKKSALAAPDYIAALARKAREENPDKELLNNIPVTTLDLTLDRLRKEAGIATKAIIDTVAGALGFDTLSAATEKTIADRKSRILSPDGKTVRLKVASANLNQTIMNYTRNVPLIKAAIDKAVADGADVLSLQELGLTGYTGDDYFLWIKDRNHQKEILSMVNEVAKYAAEKNPNLVLSLGFPLFYADKSQDVKINLGTEEHPVMVDNPLYNMDNHPFNAQAFITGGKIQAISAKSIQPNGSAEYEPRQFTSWKDYMGTKDISLPTGEVDASGKEIMQTVPFGKPVMQLKKDGIAVNLYHEICAEGWPGIYDDGSVNEKEMKQGRYLASLARHTTVSLTINPSASKPEPFLDKPSLRSHICTLGSDITDGGGYVYTNSQGLEAAPVAFEGGSIYAVGGKKVHSSERYSMTDITYSSCVMDVPVATKGTPHVTVAHNFRQHETLSKVGGPGAFENSPYRAYEEIVRNTDLWIGDYLKKSGMQGFVVSLSGGADSAYGALRINRFIDSKLKKYEATTGSRAGALDMFLKEYDHLKYADEIRRDCKEHGAESAEKLLRSKLLTCIYLPSDNSSQITENAARTLIEGGTLEDGTSVKGIGGTFRVIPIQQVVDAYITAFAGMKPFSLMDEVEKDILNQDTYKGLTHEDIRRYEYAEDKDIPADKKLIKNAIKAIKTKHAEVFKEMQEFSASSDAKVNATEELKDHPYMDKLLHDSTLKAEKTFSADNRKYIASLLTAERIRQEVTEYVKGTRQDFSDDLKAQIKKEKLLTWANPNDDTTLQNLSARVRLPFPWIVGNSEHKVACVTSNWSEAVAGYWTFGGDGHMGSINLCAGVPKSTLKNILKWEESNGMDGHAPIKALHPINVQRASAELRPLKNGQIAQYDEDDMMQYEKLDAIGDALILKKQDPVTIYDQLKDTAEFGDHLDTVNCITKACNMFHRAQFKRVASVIGPFIGTNVDPHGSQRTTIFSNFLNNGVAKLKLHYGLEQCGGSAETFKQKTGKEYGGLVHQALLDENMQKALLSVKPDELLHQLTQSGFGRGSERQITVS